MIESKFEYILTHSYKADLISYLKTHPEDFEEAIILAVSDKQAYSWRAAWLIWSCMERNDRRIQKYTAKIIDILPEIIDRQARELLIILQKMELSDELEGRLFDICITIWKKTGKQPSLRYNAFKLMTGIVKKHPALVTELKFLTETQYTESLSENVKKSVSGMLEEVKKSTDKFKNNQKK